MERVCTCLCGSALSIFVFRGCSGKDDSKQGDSRPAADAEGSGLLCSHVYVCACVCVRESRMDA